MAKRKPISKKQLRLRIFAGPNGSGKTTIINSVRAAKVNDKPIDFGNYINADDITRDLPADSLYQGIKLRFPRSGLLPMLMLPGYSGINLHQGF